MAPLILGNARDSCMGTLRALPRGAIGSTWDYVWDGLGYLEAWVSWSPFWGSS